MDGNDFLNGGGGNDTLVGGAGSDVFRDLAGDDSLAGGTGDDRYYVNSAGDSITENSGEGYDDVISSIDWTLSANVEKLTFAGVAGLAGTGNGLDNILAGNSGDNILSGMDGNDVLNGYAGNDTLNGGAGNDLLYGNVGADTMSGGTGNDEFNVDNAGDVVTEAAGEGTDQVTSSISWTLSANVENLVLTGSGDLNGTGNDLANIIAGNSGRNTLLGMDGNDVLNGYAGNDTLDGGAGDDLLYGGAGSDWMYGRTGNDEYNVDNVGDVVNEEAGEGTDKVISSISFTLGADVENLKLAGSSNLSGTGNALDNVLDANAGANSLFGLGGNDVLNGREGDDTLSGGAGADRLAGGSGNDIFAFDGGDSTAGSMDTILDFASGDKIDLAGVDANTADGTDQAFSFVGTNAFTGTAGELRYEQTGGNTYVYGDTDGDGAADLAIMLLGSHALVGTDFTL
jgi:Ca2+-binding RTX toxin-like protein